MARKGMLESRINEVVPAKQTFDEAKFEELEQDKSKTKTKKKAKKKDFANQKISIKIGTDAKADIDTIKVLEKMKFDYETIQLLVDTYKKSLSPEDRKQFNTLRDVLSDKYQSKT